MIPPGILTSVFGWFSFVISEKSGIFSQGGKEMDSCHHNSHLCCKPSHRRPWDMPKAGPRTWWLDLWNPKKRGVRNLSFPLTYTATPLEMKRLKSWKVWKAYDDVLIYAHLFHPFLPLHHCIFSCSTQYWIHRAWTVGQSRATVPLPKQTCYCLGQWCRKSESRRSQRLAAWNKISWVQLFPKHFHHKSSPLSTIIPTVVFAS